MRRAWLLCGLAAALASGAALAADEFSNPGFENGTMDGWTVGGRKDARAKVVPAEPFFKALGGNRRFRAGGGWERHPVVPALKRGSNRFLLRISSKGYITAVHESSVTIEAGRQYTVSLIVQNQNGGRATYYLDVYCLGDDGTRLPLGTCRGDKEEGELFRQSVSFTAEQGQPHVGRRIALSARYRGTNLLDNADIVVRPIDRSSIEGVMQSLPLVDTVDAQGRSRFSIRGYEDFQYARPLESVGSFENKGAPFAALAQFIPKDNPEYTLYDLDGLALRDGEAAAVTLTLVSARAHAGFAVDGNVFLLGRHGNRRKKRDDGTGMNPFRTPDYMMYIAKVSRELGPETMVIARRGDRIDWFACGRKGSYTIEGLDASPRLSLFARRLATMSRLRKGRLSRKGAAYLRSYMPAPRHPQGRPNTPGFPGTRRKDDRKFVAALSTDLDAPLSDAEIKAMVDYVSGYNGHGFGTHCDPIFNLPGWWVPAKIFLITRRKDVLDHLLGIADPAIIIRNGFEVDGVKYGVRIGGEFDRYVNLHDYCPFPGGGFESEADQGGRYFNEKHEYVNDSISRSSDPANARMITPSMAAFCISLHPEIWDRKTPGDPCKLGATYRQRAERYVKELALNYTDYKDIKLYNFQTDYIWENYTDFHRNRKVHQEALAAWEERRAASSQPRIYLDRSAKRPGVRYAYYEYEGEWNSLPEPAYLDKLTPKKEGTLAGVSIAPRDRQVRYAFRFTGWVNIEAGGPEWSLASDDGSMLYIGDKVIIDNNGRHGMEAKTGKLPAGIHPITVTFFEAGKGAVLKVGYADKARGEKALADFLKADPRPEPKERRAGINRFVAAVSCAGFAARAAETFGDRASMKAIDACAEKLLKSWFSTYQFYAPGHDGEYLNEPDKWYRAWGYQPNCVNPAARDYDTNTPRGVGTVRAEDRAHANFTMKGFYVLYESHRYEHIMTRKRMTDLARTFNEMVIPKYNQWRPMPRASKHRNVDPVNELGGVRLSPLLMFADFNPELKRKVIRALIESTYHRGMVINRVNLAEMRARKHNQIPTKIVER